MITIPKWLKKHFPIFHSVKSKNYFEIECNGKIEIVNNYLMDNTLSELIKVLNGDSTDLEIAYLAVGNDNTAVTGTEVALGNEIFRTQVSSKSITDTGKLQSEFYLLNTDIPSTQIEELGIFGGSGAGAGAGSGTLIARALYSKLKGADEQINIRRIDELIRS